MISINQIVINKKGQKGTITRIITKSTGYVEVAYEAGFTKKEMAFNLTDENGISLKKAPKKPEPKKPMDPVQVWKSIALSVNDQWNEHTRWQLAGETFGRMDAKGNPFIESLLEQMFKVEKLSEKQAYYLAKFGVETGQLK